MKEKRGKNRNKTTSKILKISSRKTNHRKIKERGLDPKILLFKTTSQTQSIWGV